MLRVERPGFLTSIQDVGRFGHRNKGVPVSGAMDDITLSRLNRLLENKPNTAGLEVTLVGPKLHFEENTYIAVGGAEFEITLNGKPIKNFQVYKINRGDVLEYGKLEKGVRGYLAVKDGLKTKKHLGSRSQFVPVTQANCLKAGNVIPYKPIVGFESKLDSLKVASHIDDHKLEAYPGPEFDRFDKGIIDTLGANSFTVSKENNRMAYQLDPPLNGHSIKILTSATLPGTVQITPAGKLIVLMKDGQTTGGYPRILQLSKEAIAILAQKKYGDNISFKPM